MKIKRGTVLIIVLFLSVSSSIGLAQDFNIENLIMPPEDTPDELKMQYAVENLDEIMDPLLDLFGFYSGGGLYHTADVHSLGGFDVGVRLVTMMVSDEQQPPLPWPQEEGLSGGVFRDVTLMPLPLIQASVGLPGNLEATGRFFTYPIGDAEPQGNLTLIGFGVKYGLLQNMMLPKVAIVAGYHYLTVPDEFDFGNISAFSGALVVSKGFPFIDLYGGIGIDYNKLEVELTLPGIGDVKKEYTKQNMRYNLGFKLKPIPLVFINADYNFGNVQGFNVGLGVSLR